MHSRPSYLRVLATFARNSLVRDMTFRANFIIDAVASLSWVLMQLGFYLVIFQYTKTVGDWGKYQFFAFLSTTLIVNSLVQTFFMPNLGEFGELIRSGNLDFAMLKPIDTQFLISLSRFEWSALSNFVFGLVLLVYSVARLDDQPGPFQAVLYVVYVACGVAILYSLMILMSSIGVWLGRNESLYDYWFYITNFSRYPMEIYSGTIGTPLRWVFTFLLPVLIVVNVPARMMARPLQAQSWPLALFALVATWACLWFSRWVFRSALASYRSASS